ncbi:MAG: glycosyltransferase family 4 protein, partial [Methanosarcinales archaeon]
MVGGEAVYTYNISKKVSNLVHCVKVITSDIGGKMNVSNDENFRLIYVHPIKKFPLKLFTFNIQAKKQLMDRCKKESIDIIHQTYDYYKIIIPKEKINVPIVATIHHPFTAERKFFKMNKNHTSYWKYLILRRIYFLEKMQKNLCERADGIIAVSRYTAQSIIEEYGIPKDKVEVIP